MKLGTHIFFCFFVFLSTLSKVNAQSWQEVQMGQNSAFLSFNSNDSSLWLRFVHPIHFDNGVFTYYNASTVPIFNFVGFTFAKPVYSTNAMYSYTSGTQFFYKFDGTAFQSIDLPGDQQINGNGNMVSHNDFLFIGTLDPSGTYTLLYYQDQLIQTYDGPYPNLIVGENKKYNFSFGAIYNVNIEQSHEQAIDNIWSSNHKILDAKLLPGTDTLFYTRIDHIGVANGTEVVDSITSINSNQMPVGHPRKLCFDFDGNLWVLFGNSNCNGTSHYSTFISKYNRTTHTWEQTTNLADLLAPYLGFSTSTIPVELEVDSYNNIWLMFGYAGVSKYFMFQQGDLPAWVGTSEISLTNELAITPNPSDGIFQVSSISTEPMKITILDQQGKQVAQFELDELSSNNSFDLREQAPGVYFAHVSQGGQQWVKKLVVR